MVLQKTYLTYEGTSLVDTYISEAKEELIPHVLTQTKKRIIDLSFVDTCTRDYSDNFFYLVKITIGANTILKYGMTNQKPRKRFVQIKNDIALNYNKQTITLEPLMIIHCNNAESFEEEIKTCLSEHNISTTGYKFKGSTETIRYRELNDTLDVIHLLGEKFQTDVLYAS